MIRGPGDSIADPRWGPQMQMALPIFAGYFRHAKEEGEGGGQRMLLVVNTHLEYGQDVMLADDQCSTEPSREPGRVSVITLTECREDGMIG